jgi:hypothetical protein
MSTITTNPLREQRARIAADAVVSAYINELSSTRPKGEETLRAGEERTTPASQPSHRRTELALVC